MYVYADLFLGINVLLNSCMIVLTAKLCGVQIRWRRILVASGMGGIYALGALYFEWDLLYSTPMKFFSSLVLIHAAFCPQTLRSLFQITAAYYIVCFVTGGAIVACSFYRQTFISSLLQPISSYLGWPDLLGGASLAFCLMFIVKVGFLANLLRNNREYKLEIEYKGAKTTLTAILDTGNSLYSIGCKPVIITEHHCVQTLLSQETQAFLLRYRPDEWAENLHLCKDKNWLTRVQLIPFRALAGDNILVSFRPDRVRVQLGDSIIETSDVIVGIYAGTLSPNKQYTALLHPAILNFSVRKEVKTCVSPG